MAWRKLAEGSCGDENALLKLTTHYNRGHTFSEPQIHHTDLNTSDHLVEEFLQEAQAIPQSFRMDDLMKEVHEINLQSLVAAPISSIKDSMGLNSNSWSREYSHESEAQHFNGAVDHNLVWAEISAREQGNISSNKDDVSVSEINIQQSKEKTFNNLQSNKTQEYQEFVEFMKKMNSEQYHSSDMFKNFEGDPVESWANEYVDNTVELEQQSDDFWEKLQNEWKKIAENTMDGSHPWLDDLEELTKNQKEYEFFEDNPMLNEPNPYEKGKEMLKIGNFPSAVLCFEAAVQKDPDSADAWLLLGTTQAENERDPYAICALKKCIQIQPENLDAHMALSVSYANENYHNQACLELVEWLKYNPNYAHIVPRDLQLSGSQHNTVQELFIKAAQKRPHDPDYEVQCGLGILFNLSGEYEKAVDCFRAALTVQSNNARLWNRLGATLANGSRPEEAIESYHRALSLCPGFIRARYNVAITCINLAAYKEAAEHLLIALNQQSGGKTYLGDIPQTSTHMSDAIWSTLRMCISLTNQLDLRPAVDRKDLETLNRAFSIENK